MIIYTYEKFKGTDREFCLNKLEPEMIIKLTRYIIP